RVDIAEDDHRGRVVGEQVGLVPLHNPSGLPGVCVGPDSEPQIRWPDPQLLEEDGRHPLAVVLASVD
ncbi:hypothetical protein Q8G41_28930, partial [Klebsiella pneumoniae]